ncbi:MAG: amino acid deaminase/aldolase [Bacteroidota bacterium]
MNLPGYNYYKSVFSGFPMPFAFVDLDLLFRNAEAVKKRSGHKTIRIASKSIRCRYLLRQILDSARQFDGIMCFSVREMLWLNEHGFQNLLMGYPAVNFNELNAVALKVKAGNDLTLMADLPEHFERINEVGKKQDVVINVCLDLDLSTRFPGIWFGVKRSALRTIKDVELLVSKIKSCKHVKLTGLMGYEAQVAGVTDKMPGQFLMNSIIKFLKRKSIKTIAQKRQQSVELLSKNGLQPAFVNGGGTGSLESTSSEPVVTEVTVGSGFYASHLFDNYQQFKHLPAAGFAIEVVRKPEPELYTCMGGGYVASGSIGKEKVPQPYLPLGASLIEHEMAGEVQTPVRYRKEAELSLGDPVFFRHSKAGELCEHFNEIHLVSEGKILKTVPTYRGEGFAFL